MTSKKNEQASTSGVLPALKIGSRVRCSEDGVEGRIVWANGICVKMQWDDGEQVTWRRDSLAERPIEIVEPAAEEDATVKPGADSEQAVSTTGPLSTDSQSTIEDSIAAAVGHDEAAERQKASEAPQETRLSALDAAAKVLVEEGKPMNCQEMIQTMAARGYWTSPVGKTPHATLYSALLRDLKIKREQSRFQKVARGRFSNRRGADANNYGVFRLRFPMGRWVITVAL